VLCLSLYTLFALGRSGADVLVRKKLETFAAFPVNFSQPALILSSLASESTVWFDASVDTDTEFQRQYRGLFQITKLYTTE